MRSFIGIQERQPGVPAPPGDSSVWYDPSTLITGHVLICGMSGTGKSHQSKRLLEAAAAAGATVDVFDVHEELHDIKGAVCVKYSQHTKFGFNPLVVSLDPHTGGPQRRSDDLVRLIKQVSPSLGVQQEMVLRNLCNDTYAASGIFQGTASTWERAQVSETLHDQLVAMRKFSELRKYYPTLSDLRSYAMRTVARLTIGGDNKSMTAHEEVVSSLRRLHKLNTRSNRSSLEGDAAAKLEQQVKEAKASYLEALAAYVDGLTTGKELDDILKYKSVDVLSSVITRLDLLNSTGIFRSNDPPFGAAGVRVHQVKSLGTDQQILFAKLRMKAIFESLKEAGPVPEGAPPRHFIFLEEAQKYFDTDPDDIVNVLSREARKFGLSLVCASQQPTDFPKDFLTNVGMTLLCGIHGSYWRGAVGMLGASEAVLSRIRPKEVVAVKLQRARETNPAFVAVAVPNPGTLMGRQAASADRAARQAA